MSRQNDSMLSNGNRNAKPASQRGAAVGGGQQRLVGLVQVGVVKNRTAGGSKLAVPKPINLPSFKKEHSGNDPSTKLVPKGGTSGWKTEETHRKPPSQGFQWSGAPSGEIHSVDTSKVSTDTSNVINAGRARGSESSVPYANYGPATRSFPLRSTRSDRLNPSEYPTLSSAASNIKAASATPQPRQPQRDEQSWDDDERDTGSNLLVHTAPLDRHQREAGREGLDGDRFTGRVPPTGSSYRRGGGVHQEQDNITMPRFASHLDGNLFGPSALLVDYAPFERKVPVMDEYAFTGSRHVNIGQAGSSEFNFAGPFVKDVSSNIRGQPPAPSGSRQKMEQTQAAAETERDLEREAYDKEVEAVACLLKLERKEKRKLEERWVEETKSREEEKILAAHLLEMSLPPGPSLPDRTHESPTSPLQQPVTETINVEESHDPDAGIEIKPLEGNGLSTETIQAGSKLIGKLVPRSELATAYRLRMEEEEAQRKSAAQRKLLALEERMQAQRIEERVKENGSVGDAEVQVEAARTIAEPSAPVQSMGTSKPSSNGPIATPHHLSSPPQKFPSPPPTITEAVVGVGGDASRSTEVQILNPPLLSTAEESEVHFKLVGRDWEHNSLQSAAESHEMGTSSTIPDEASFMSNIPMADAVGPPGFDGSAHLVEAFAEVQLKKAHSDKRETSRHAFASGGAEVGMKGSVAKVTVSMSGPPQMSLRHQDDELAAIEPIAALGKAERKPTRVMTRDGAKKRPPPGMPLQPTQPNLTEAMLRSVMPQLTPFLFGEHAASNLPNSSFAYTPDRAVAPASPCGDHSAGSGSISRLNRYLGQYQDE